MSRMRNLIRSTAEYTRLYSGFDGVATEAPRNASTTRLALCENMYRDYGAQGAAAIESIPGYRLLSNFADSINGIYRYKSYSDDESFIIHAGDGLYRIRVDGLNVSEPVRLATVRNAKSAGFVYGNYFYLLDGADMTRVAEDDSSERLCYELDPYIPTLYVDGAAHEARNLLTDAFAEEYNLIDAQAYAHGTPELKYEITDPNQRLVSVVGLDKSFSGELDIPGYVILGAVKYRVSEIADSAFLDCKGITRVRIGEGVERIGKFAFDGCIALTTLSTPDSLIELGNVAMYECTALKEIYLREGLERISTTAFTGCYNLKTVHYSGDKESYSEIENSGGFSTFTVIYGSSDNSMRIELPLNTDAARIDAVTADGAPRDFTLGREGGEIRSVLLLLENRWDINGTVVKISGTLKEKLSDFNGSTEPGRYSGREAILGCTVAELFDGRIFLSGNPALPNTVFFSSRDKNGGEGPCYFGEFNYMNDGVGAYPVRTMLAVRDSLAVFKAGDDGTGSIFYHERGSTSDPLMPRVYPVSSIHSGICALGDSLTFLDDPVFLSPIGLAAMEKRQLNYDRSVVSRSENVNFCLLKEDMSEARLVSWMGYLAVCCGENIYLADPRATFLGATGNVQYEWFVLKGIGAYTGLTAKYRYDSASPIKNVFANEEMADRICEKTVYSVYSDGTPIYYTKEGGTYYAVSKEYDMKYTGFMPARVFCSDGTRLLFGTDNGDVYIFNNDLIGVAPPDLAERRGFDPEEYAAYMSRRLHPRYYSFGGVAPTYLIRTERDDCGVPHLTKNTVRGSLVLKCKSYASGEISCEVSTDRSDYTEVARFFSGILDFSELDFARFTFGDGEDVTIALKEREKEWIEKDITVSSREFACPIGIYSIAFRYKIRGRIKRSH